MSASKNIKNYHPYDLVAVSVDGGLLWRIVVETDYSLPCLRVVGLGSTIPWFEIGVEDVTRHWRAGKDGNVEEVTK